MLNNRTNKQKIVIIATGIICLLWVCYQFSFSKTIGLWKECKRLEQQQALIKEIPKQLPELIGKVDQLEKMLGNSEENDFSTLILEQVNMLCQKNYVRLKEIPEKHVFNGENLIVETVDVNLQGGFADQLKIISELENNQVNTRLRSVKFQSIINQTTGERKLQSTLFLQSIKLIPNHSNQ